MSEAGSSDALHAFPAELLQAFEPLDTLGAGAMGAVYLARDRRLGREVAVKLLHAAPDTTMQRRFHGEAEALARVRHPNVVAVYDHGLTKRGPYIVMERLQGTELETLPEGADAMTILLQVADGLAEIHRLGLVHRDLKPANILLTTSGRAVIVDFGLVRDPKRTRLTREGDFVGTFAVSAPELLRLEEATPASDWYSWGATGYHLFEGRFPYSLPQLLPVTEGADLPPPRFSKLSPDDPRAEVLRQALATDPARRPADVDAIRAVLASAPSSPAPPDTRAVTSPQSARHAALRSSEIGGSSRQTQALAPHSTSLSLSTLLDAGRGRRRLLTGAGACLVLGLSLAGLWWSGRGDARAVDTPLPAPALPPPLMEGYGEAVLAEIEELRGTDPKLFQPDPALYGSLMRRLESVEAFHDWLQLGGDPGILSPEQAAALQTADDRFVELGLARPFYPALYLAPAEGEVRLPDVLRAPRFEVLGLPERPTGWLATCLTALDDTIRESERLTDELYARVPTPPEGFAPEIWAARPTLLASRPTLLEFVRSGAHLPDFRQGLVRWLQPGADSLRRFFYAGHRSMAEEPDTREQLAFVMGLLRDAISAFFYGPQAFLEASVVLGGPSKHPTQLYWLASLHRVDRLVRVRTGVPAQPRWQRQEAEAWWGASVRSHGATVSRLRAAHALSACYLALSQPLLAELVLERFRDSRDRLRELSVAERALAYPIVAQAATTPDVVVTGEMLLEILRELESLGASDDASVNQDLIAARVAAVRRRIGG